jgi:hypothetical protein
VVNDLNPRIVPQRALIARWSCSTILVQIRALSHVHSPPCGMLASQQPQRPVTRPVSIKRDFARWAARMRSEGIAEERLGGSNAAVFAQEEVDGTSLLVDRSI